MATARWLAPLLLSAAAAEILFCSPPYNGATWSITGPGTYNFSTNAVGTYSPDASCSITLTPGPGLGMQLSFERFATEPNFDFFRAAASPATSALPLLPWSSGFAVPALGGALYSPVGQSVTLEFTSDEIDNYGGVSVLVTALGSPPSAPARACEGGATGAAACGSLAAQGCNYCSLGAAPRCEFTGRTASEAAQLLTFPSLNPCSSGGGGGGGPSGPPPGSSANTCASLPPRFGATKCLDRELNAATERGAAAAGIAISVLLGGTAGLGAWLLLTKRVGGAPLPAAAPGEPPGLRLALLLLAAALGCCVGAGLLALAAPSMPWLIRDARFGSYTYSIAYSPLGGFREGLCDASSCISYTLPEIPTAIPRLTSQPSRLLLAGAALVLCALALFAPAAVLLGAGAGALKRHLLLALTPGGSGKAADALAPHCCLNLQAAYALAWTGFAVALATYVWLTAEFATYRELSWTDGPAYTSPGATAADLALSLAFFGALFGTLAGCRTGALAGLRPGPCGRCCCGGRCAPQLLQQTQQLQQAQPQPQLQGHQLQSVALGGSSAQVVAISHSAGMSVQQNPVQLSHSWAGR